MEEEKRLDSHRTESRCRKESRHSHWSLEEVHQSGCPQSKGPQPDCAQSKRHHPDCALSKGHQPGCPQLNVQLGFPRTDSCWLEGDQSDFPQRGSVLSVSSWTDNLLFNPLPESQELNFSQSNVHQSECPRSKGHEPHCHQWKGHESHCALSKDHKSNCALSKRHKPHCALSKHHNLHFHLLNGLHHLPGCSQLKSRLSKRHRINCHREGSDEQASSSSWWDNWYDSAKKKLSETNDFMMRDMREFTEAVKEDASRLVASTAAQMKDQLNININLEEASEATKTVTNSLTDFLGKVVKQVAPQEPDDSDDDSFLLGTGSGVRMLNPTEARLYHLQTNPSTYCTGPDNDLDYEQWSEGFLLDAQKEEISLLMLDSKEVRSIYTKLVPEAVSHSDFWTRYFYKKALLEQTRSPAGTKMLQAEERRAKLVERAVSTLTDLSWGDDDDDDTAFAVPPMVNNDTNATTASSFSHQTSETPSSPPMPVVHEAADVNTKKSNDEATEEQEQNTTTEKEKGDGSTPSKSNQVVEEKKEEEEEEAVIPPVSATQNELVVTTDVATTSTSDLVVPSAEKSQQQQSDDPLLIAKNNSSELCDDKSETTLSSKEASSCEIIESVDYKSPKDSSSGNSSDWEKEFDIDMTEEEISNVLEQTPGEDIVVEDDWEGWE